MKRWRARAMPALLLTVTKRSVWYRHTVALVPAHSLSRQSGMAMPGRLRPWKPGEFRVAVLLVGDRELVGPPFRVVDGA